MLISVRRSAIGVRMRKHGSSLLVLPALSVVAILVAGIGVLAWDSLHTFNAFYATLGNLSLTQYASTVTDPQFKVDIVRTLAMGSLTSVVAVTLALPVALVITRSKSRLFRLALLIVTFVPWLTGDITRTFGWLVVLGPRGPLVWLCNQLGIAPPSLIATLWAVGFGTVQVLVPPAVVILLPAILRLDPELEYAANTLGARPYQAFLRVTLPQLRVACFGALAACWALGMGDFADPQILGQGVRDYLANFLQNRYLELGDVPQGAATGVILIVLVTLGAALILTLGRLRWPRRLSVGRVR